MKTKTVLVACLLSILAPISFASDSPSSDQMRNETRADAREAREIAKEEAKKSQAAADAAKESQATKAAHEKRLRREHLRMTDVKAASAS